MREMMASLGSGGGLLSKIPGLGRLAGDGGLAGLDPSALLGASRGGPSARQLARKRPHQKGKRKQARKARRKNRRR